MTRLSDAARDALEALYTRCAFPDVHAREALANELNLEARQVQVWFQNKRQRERMRNNGPAFLTAAQRSTQRTSSQQHITEHQLSGHLRQLVRAPLGGSIAKSIAKPQISWKQHERRAVVPNRMDALDVLAYAASVMSETDASDAATSDADASDAEQMISISP